MAAQLAGGLAAFMVGVLGGALLTRELDTHASWVAAGVFLVAGVLWLRPSSRRS